MIFWPGFQPGTPSAQLQVPASQGKPPPGYRLTAGQVAAIASGAVQGDVSQARRIRVRYRLGSDGQRQWQVDFFEASASRVSM